MLVNNSDRGTGRGEKLRGKVAASMKARKGPERVKPEGNALENPDVW